MDDHRLEVARQAVRTALDAAEHGIGEGEAAVLRMAVADELVATLRVVRTIVYGDRLLGRIDDLLAKAGASEVAEPA